MTRLHGHKTLPVVLFPFIFLGIAAAASPDRRLLSLVPPGAQLVAAISAPSTQGQPDNFVLMTHNNRVDLEDFFALTGADSSHTIQEMVFVAIASSQGPPNEHSLLVSGHFDQPRLFQSATDGGAAATNYRRIPVLEIHPFPRERNTFNDVRWLAVLDSNILVFGSIMSVRAELDRYLGRTSPDPGLIRNLGRLSSKDQTWCVLSPPARNDEIYAALAALNPELAKLAQSGDAFEFGLHYGRRVKFEYEATGAPTATSRPSLDSLRQGTVQSAKYASLLPALSVAGNADTLHHVIEVPMSRYKAWLSEIRGGQFPADRGTQNGFATHSK
jgi:hypothetical protein